MTDAANIAAKALEPFPAHIREDLLGAAYLKAHEVQHLLPEGHVRRVRNHIRYARRRDRSRALQPFDRADPRGNYALDAVDLADELDQLDPVDRSIIVAILAGHTFREAGGLLGISAATICRRLRRLRETWGAALEN